MHKGVPINNMKITLQNNTLGKKEEQNFTSYINVLATGASFKMSRKDIKDNGVAVNLVNDKLGMVMAVASLGDKIGKTIRKASNFNSLEVKTLLPEAKEILNNSDSVVEAMKQIRMLPDNSELGLEAACQVALFFSPNYWAAYNKEEKEIDMEVVKNNVMKHDGETINPVYGVEDIWIESNKNSMCRMHYIVNDYYLLKFMSQIKKINAKTTIAEIKKLQADFGLITRGLGESTIDVKKHINNVLALDIDQIISPAFKVIGGIKADKTDNNIMEALYDEVKFVYDFKDFNYSDWSTLIDNVGLAKLAGKEEIEDAVNSYIDTLRKTTNSDGWKNIYNFDLNDDGKYNTFCVYLDNTFRVLYSLGKERDNRTGELIDNKEILAAALINKGLELGIAKEDIIKVTNQFCLSTVRKDGTISSVFNDPDFDRNPRLHYAATLFNDIFVAEYIGESTIKVPVEYDSEITAPEGTQFALVDGVAAAGMIHVYGPYQNGVVEVVEGGLCAIYNPIDNLMEKYGNARIISIKNWAGTEDCTFRNWTSATKNTHAGYDAIEHECRVMSAPIDNAVLNKGQMVLLDENSKPLAIANEYASGDYDNIWSNLIVTNGFVVGLDRGQIK